MTTIDVDGRGYAVCVPHAETDYIQSNLVRTGRPYEERMLEAMAAALEPGDLVVDVGANIGNHTLYLAVVGELRVVAYEPNPELVAGIRASVEANGLGERVVVRDVGVHARSARGVLADLDATNLGAQSVAVAEIEGDFAVVALDEETFPGRVAAVKIDVEGAELEVLRGAQELITRDRPRLFIESGTLAGFQDVRAFLDDLGYVLTGTYNLTPTHSYRPAVGSPEEAELVASLVAATEEVYRLNSLKVDLRARLAERGSESRSA
ncbi:FkbM family methyltransferase [Nocardioides sp. NPDC051685]|uniref:FkbM family methyltransferase n=1 Tax=Nocardioides sp. NPDC051685 TaxID=3364334 RepID=UPI0037B92B1E